MSCLIFGRNPVIEAIKNGREIDKILMQKGGEGSAKKIEAMARDRRILIQYADKATLDRVLRESCGKNHQGVVAYVSSYKYYDIDDIFKIAVNKGEEPFFIISDGIEDPHNLGAIIRTAEGAGAHGVIIPKRRAAGVTETVAKSAAGALEYLPVVKVGNLAQTVDVLKERGVWIAACHMEGAPYYMADFSIPTALIIGSEGRGVSSLLLRKSDFTFSIPMEGKISSLNASNAAAIIMYEIRRQRDCK